MVKSAYIVRHGERQLGYLGEGPGPFLSNLRTDLPPLDYDLARFTSLFPKTEAGVRSAIENALDFAALKLWCEAQGYTLEPVPYDEVFS